MKIALASDWFLPRIGGLELQMRDLAVELTAAGHRVEVIAATEGPSEVMGVPVHRIDASPLIAYGQLSWRPRVARDVERVLAQGGFDVVHCHSALSPLSLMAVRAARRLGLPTVFTEHSVMHGAGGVILSGVNRLNGWSQWPDVMTGVSSVVARGLSDLFGREVHVLPNGVTPDAWVASDHSRDPVRVLSVMRLTSRKQPLDFVRAIPRVLEQMPAGAAPRFVLIGDGPQRLRVLLEAKRLGVSKHLEFRGQLDRSDVRDALAETSVFALPTEKEALSIASLEALSSGVPVVAMSHGGVGDIVTHGETGYLADDPGEFARYIARLAADAALRRSMAERGPSVAERFAWPRVVARHLEIYDMAISVVARRRRGESLDARAEIGARAARPVG